MGEFSALALLEALLQLSQLLQNRAGRLTLARPATFCKDAGPIVSRQRQCFECDIHQWL